MRIMIFFDLPILTEKNKKDYRDFRKYLLKSGFLMMQESVYCKLVPNSSAGDAVIDNIRKHSPSDGIVQALRVTEKQYSKIEYIVGRSTSTILDTDERLVIL